MEHNHIDIGGRGKLYSIEETSNVSISSDCACVFQEQPLYMGSNFAAAAGGRKKKLNSNFRWKG